jgi:hypothetical protein
MDRGGIWSYERSWEVIAIVLLLAPVVLILGEVAGTFVVKEVPGWDRLLHVATGTSYGAWPALVLAGTLALLRVSRDWTQPLWLLAFVLGAGGALLSLFAAYRAVIDSYQGLTDAWAFRGAEIAAVLSGGVVAAIAAWVARPRAFPSSPPLPEGNEEEWTQL